MYTLRYVTSKGFPVTHEYKSAYELGVSVRVLLNKFKRAGIPCRYAYDKRRKTAIVVNM